MYFVLSEYINECQFHLYYADKGNKDEYIHHIWRF